MTHAKLLAAAELVWLGCLFWLALWAPAWTGVRGWNVAALVLFFATMAVSLAAHRPALKESGLRLDNLVPALKSAGIFAGAVVILMGLVAGALPPAPWAEPRRLLQYIGFGVFQQTLVLGYFLQRWQILLPRAAAASANALCFALMHLPDVTLALVAGVGELIFTWLFFRARNVLAIGVAHGVLSLALLPFLLDVKVMQTPRIGPAPLRALGAAVDALAPRADAAAICSRVIAPDQLGEMGRRKLERIARGRKDDEAIRRALAEFLRRDRTALCMITERELHRYIEPARRAELSIAAERYIWRSPGNPPVFSAQDPIFGLFRDRVLLISNRPLAEP